MNAYQKKIGLREGVINIPGGGCTNLAPPPKIDFTGEIFKRKIF